VAGATALPALPPGPSRLAIPARLAAEARAYARWRVPLAAIVAPLTELVLTETDSSRRAALARRARQLARCGRRHGLFLALVAGGLVARIAVTLAYQPAILSTTR
jgi:hypothetical protein